MKALLDYLAMGGYAQFVWPAYAVTVTVMLLLLGASLGSYRAKKRALDRADPAGRRGRT